MAILWTVARLTNCSCNRATGDTSSSTSTSGRSVTITANDGYIFDNPPYTYKETVSNVQSEKTFTVNSTKTKLTATITTNATRANITDITANASVSYSYTVGTMTNCVCNKSTGDTVSSGDTITVTANDNYEFTSDYYYITVGTENRVFTKSDDNKTLTYNITSVENVSIGDITADLSYLPTTSKFLNIYKPTNDILDSLASKRFIDISQDKYFDYGNYILQLYRCYLPIPTKYIKTENIILANSDTEISCDTLVTNIINVECDITTSNMLYDTDYSAFLYIPNNTGYISIDVNRIFNKTLKIKLSYELYTNICNYSLYDNDIMFDCGSFTFGSNIPFRFYENIAQNSYTYNPPIEKCCCLMVVGDTIVNISDISYEFFNGDLLDIDNSNINDNDYDELVTLLNSGIYK